jgi:hypothetical protein
LFHSLTEFQFVDGVRQGGVWWQLFGYFQQDFLRTHGFNLHSNKTNVHDSAELATVIHGRIPWQAGDACSRETCLGGIGFEACLENDVSAGP